MLVKICGTPLIIMFYMNKKLKHLISLEVKNSNINNFLVPVTNFPCHVLTEKEQNHL